MRRVIFYLFSYLTSPTRGRDTANSVSQLLRARPNPTTPRPDHNTGNSVPYSFYISLKKTDNEHLIRPCFCSYQTVVTFPGYNIHCVSPASGQNRPNSALWLVPRACEKRLMNSLFWKRCSVQHFLEAKNESFFCPSKHTFTIPRNVFKKAGLLSKCV